MAEAFDEDRAEILRFAQDDRVSSICALVRCVCCGGLSGVGEN
jgi:hypothetical protein